MRRTVCERGTRRHPTRSIKAEIVTREQKRIRKVKVEQARGSNLTPECRRKNERTKKAKKSMNKEESLRPTSNGDEPRTRASFLLRSTTTSPPSSSLRASKSAKSAAKRLRPLRCAFLVLLATSLGESAKSLEPASGMDDIQRAGILRRQVEIERDGTTRGPRHARGCEALRVNVVREDELKRSTGRTVMRTRTCLDSDVEEPRRNRESGRQATGHVARKALSVHGETMYGLLLEARRFDWVMVSIARHASYSTQTLGKGYNDDEIGGVSSTSCCARTSFRCQYRSLCPGGCAKPQDMRYGAVRAVRYGRGVVRWLRRDVDATESKQAVDRPTGGR
ncbi:hypothetical protein B0H16DRAFT_1458011 [Mycena metata]|uniref:Uncharacterized protein n=1 Tax=Mycena metata TaxID=1033252 RepID=A0AAD7J3T2_9AGAR|nr:hypothetical protein B0H16DRAFT_1458011 [Mycena metata]